MISSRKILTQRIITLGCKSAINSNNLLWRYAPSYTTFYEKVKNQHFYHTQYKSSNLKFENQGVTLLAYQFHPLLGQLKNIECALPGIITRNKVLALNFLTETDDEVEFILQKLQDEAWLNRKAVSLNLSDIQELLKLNQKHPNVSIYHTYQSGEDELEYHINIDFLGEKKQVAFFIELFKSKSGEKNHIWEVNFLLSDQEYSVLVQWIRSGLYYTSGAAVMVELSKIQALKKAAMIQDMKKKKKSMII